MLRRVSKFAFFRGFPAAFRKNMGPFIKIASRKDFARTLQETQGMNKFEYTIMEALRLVRLSI